jgi:hypothetical protein
MMHIFVDKLLLNRCLSQSADDPLEEFSISPSTMEQLPLTIKQILDEQRQQPADKESIDMWTPEAEAQYRTQMQSLNRKPRSFIAL